MAFLVTQGTKEAVPATVDDLTDAVTSLSGASPKYSVRRFDDVDVYSAQATTASGMVISCLLDTTAAGPTGALWPLGRYRLYVHFNNGSEVVKLGPVYFDVVL